MRWHRSLRNLWSRQPIKQQKRRERRVLLQLEELETRALLSASSVMAQTNSTTIAPAQSSGFTGYTPQQLETAYGVPTTVNGKLAGTGQTIAIVDAYNDPNIINDLAHFDAKYFPTLGAANLTVVDQKGNVLNPSTETTVPSDPSWAVEESLDVEWAHAIAPGANIVLVEANSSSLNDLMTAVQTAASMPGVGVVSMSWGAGEFSSETSYDGYFQPYNSTTNPNGYKNNSAVTFVASAGDSSAWFGPEWPASSPNVLAVGGTTLKLTNSNTIASETAWSTSFSPYYGIEGGGGGISSYETAPSFQSSIPAAKMYDARTTPDVAWDANPNTGVSVYDSYQEPGWGYVGGTSAGAPAWAGIVAIADQQAGHSLSTSQVETTLYGVYNSSGGANYKSGSAYTQDFHDITQGNNGYPAAKGYDLATGLGSPKVSSVVALLSNSPAIASGTTTGTTTSGSSQGTGRGPAHPHDVLGTSSGVIVSEILVLATNVPISVSPASSIGSSASASNNVSAFGLSFTGPSMSFASNTPLFNGSLSSSGPQSTLVFGASGWSGSALSWHLSSLGLTAPLGDRLADDRPDDLQDLDDPSAGDPISVNEPGEDLSVLDLTAPPLLDGEDSGSEGDGGGDGGE